MGKVFLAQNFRFLPSFRRSKPKYVTNAGLCFMHARFSLLTVVCFSCASVHITHTFCELGTEEIKMPKVN